MDTFDESTVLCGANSYEEKYYFNDRFASLPSQVKEELRTMCILFVAKVGGILILEYEDDGSLIFRVSSHENDFAFDEVGSGLEIGKLRQDKAELLSSLELYYRVFFLNKEGK